MSDQKNPGTYFVSDKPRHPHLKHILAIHDNDSRVLHIKEVEYDASWKKRGGVGAFMMLARKWDRLEAQVKQAAYNIFHAISTDIRDEGILDDIRDLRRYLALVEAEMIEQGKIGPPAMERTDWPSINAASRDFPGVNAPMRALKETDARIGKIDTDQGQDKVPHSQFSMTKDPKPPWMAKEPEPSDRPLTEMIKNDMPPTTYVMAPMRNGGYMKMTQYEAALYHRLAERLGWLPALTEEMVNMKAQS